MQLATGVLVAATRQVVATKELAAVAALAVHVGTGTSVAAVTSHVVVVKALALFAFDGVQLATGVGPVTTGEGHVVVVYPFVAVGADGVQLATGLVLLFDVQVVVMKSGAVGETGVQEATPVGPLTGLTVQIVAVHWFELRAASGVQVDTTVSGVVTVLHVVVL